MLEEMDRVLGLKENGQLMSYDTTFQLGDFYVSSLIFRHMLFEQEPCIPALFLIHERKYTETHEVLFHMARKLIPSLAKLRLPMVTDREKAITSAIKNKLANVTLVHCWNHLKKDVEMWCKKHGGKSTDAAVYCEDVHSLFEKESESEYAEMLSSFREKWDPVFHEYYMNQIHPDISGIGRWNLEKLGIYHPYSGITNNQSESLNRYVG